MIHGSVTVFPSSAWVRPAAAEIQLGLAAHLALLAGEPHPHRILRMRWRGPGSCHDPPDVRAAPPRLAGRGRGRAARPAHRHRANDRQRRVQPGRRGDRRAGLPGPRARRGRRGTPVGGRRPPAGRGAAEVRLIHPPAVAPGPGAGFDLRHHEPVALRGHRHDRARPGGDAGVPRPAVGGPAGLAPRRRHRVRPDHRDRGRRPGEAAAEHPLRRHLPGLAGRRVLGRVHPGEPGCGSPLIQPVLPRSAADWEAIRWLGDLAAGQRDRR